MKATHFLGSIFAALIATASLGAETLVPDLKAIPSGKGWKGATGIISLTEKERAPAVAAKGTGVVWLDGFDFTNGVIEFDGKGKSGPLEQLHGSHFSWNHASPSGAGSIAFSY